MNEYKQPSPYNILEPCFNNYITIIKNNINYLIDNNIISNNVINTYFNKHNMIIYTSPISNSIILNNIKQYINHFKHENDYIDDNNLLLYFTFNSQRNYQNNPNTTYTTFINACRKKYYYEIYYNLRDNKIVNSIYNKYNTILHNKLKNVSKKEFYKSHLPPVYKNLTLYLNKTLQMYNDFIYVKQQINVIICKYYILYDILCLNIYDIHNYITSLIEYFDLNNDDCTYICNYITKSLQQNKKINKSLNSNILKLAEFKF